MGVTEQELKEIFVAEAKEQQEGIDQALTELEKHPNNQNIIAEIFRLVHTLKGNAGGIGYEDIETLAHKMESVFSAVRSKNLLLTTKMFNLLFEANDHLDKLILNITQPQDIDINQGKSLNESLDKILKNEDSTDAATESFPEVDKDTSSEEDLQEVNKITFSDIVQIPVRKLDSLLNLVGELIIEKDKAIAFAEQLEGDHKLDVASLHRITSDLQYSVMNIRLIKIDVLFSKFHRIVRDIAQLENKNINLTIEGSEIEIDRNILQIISDSVVHLIRNAVGHGIEPAEDRKKSSKPPQGHIKLTAKSEKDNIIIEVMDDGKGIDVEMIKKIAIKQEIITEEAANNMSEDEILACIFLPGFSSADHVTEISGRGVGMDVVKNTIDKINGHIKIRTEVGKGSKFILTIPSTLAVKGALLFELNKEIYAIPLTYTESVISFDKSDLHQVAGSGLVADYNGHTISVIPLHELFKTNLSYNQLQTNGDSRLQSFNNKQKYNVIVVLSNNRHIGFVVDKLLQQKEIVEKPLEKPVDKTAFFSGVTIMGDGRVCLVLDVNEIGRYLLTAKNKMAATAA